MIPRVMHQIWLGETGAGPPPRFADAAATWRAAHPLYRSYPYWAQRADAARYLVLHAHGGVYADLDVVCVRPFEALLDADPVLAPTWPIGLSWAGRDTRALNFLGALWKGIAGGPAGHTRATR